MPPVYRNKNRKGARNEKETISETGCRIQHGFRTAINSVPMDSVENTALMAGAFTISSNRIPLAFPGFRIAQVSDLHNAEFGKGNETLLPEYGRLKAGLDEAGVTALEDQSVQIGRDGETVTLIGLSGAVFNFL